MSYNKMNFEEFCFPEDNLNYGKPSPSHDSTLMESNDAQRRWSGSNSDSEGDMDEQRSIPMTKLIRKKYDPIKDGDRIIRFEDNPSEYRKARKYNINSTQKDPKSFKRHPRQRQKENSCGVTRGISKFVKREEF